MSKLLIVTFLMLPFLAQAYGPSESSCEFYQELENRMNCGPQGYPLSFGFRLCEIYRKKEKSENQAIKRWFPKVRYCLQEKLHENAHQARHCGELKSMAINSHIPCYIETGYCQLSRRSIARILMITGSDAFNLDVVRVGARVSGHCLLNGSRPPLNGSRPPSLESLTNLWVHKYFKINKKTAPLVHLEDVQARLNVRKY